MMTSSASTITLLRRALAAILVLGIVGAEVELLLLKHIDGVWQLAPIVLNGVALLVCGWYALTRNAAAIRTLQAVMIIFLVSGGIGMIQHFRGNMAYAVDSNPSLAGRELYTEAVMGSTPTLAPGMMVQLALVGLAFAFRHPRLRAKPGSSGIVSESL